MYNVEFPDCAVKKYSGNVIEMSIQSQVESDGHNLKVLDMIVYYKQKNSAVPKANAFITTSGFKTRGLHLSLLPLP